MRVSTIEHATGGYRFIPAVSQYSAGVAALPGFRIERVRFAEPLPMARGWKRIATRLDGLQRPRSALCACELRSPAPFTEAGFRAFNAEYSATLAEWGILQDDRNPVARSNVCPALTPPLEPCFHAFCFTVPEADAPPSFVVAGSGEAEEGHATYRERTIAFGDVSPEGLRAKANFVVHEMERRMAALGARWTDTTGVQAYTVHDLHPFFTDLLAARGATRHGLTWHHCRPPVEGLEFEMDCRSVALERTLR